MPVPVLFGILGKALLSAVVGKAVTSRLDAVFPPTSNPETELKNLVEVYSNDMKNYIVNAITQLTIDSQQYKAIEYQNGRLHWLRTTYSEYVNAGMSNDDLRAKLEDNVKIADFESLGLEPLKHDAVKEACVQEFIAGVGFLIMIIQEKYRIAKDATERTALSNSIPNHITTASTHVNEIATKIKNDYASKPPHEDPVSKQIRGVRWTGPVPRPTPKSYPWKVLPQTKYYAYGGVEFNSVADADAYHTNMINAANTAVQINILNLISDWNTLLTTPIPPGLIIPP